LFIDLFSSFYRYAGPLPIYVEEILSIMVSGEFGKIDI
jgi:hypothetical protein